MTLHTGCLLIPGRPWEFPLFTPHLWKLLGSKGIEVLEDATFLATLCISTYTEQRGFPVGIFLQKQSILVFASLPALLAVMEWPSFLRPHAQGSTTSSLDCLCRTSCLKRLPIQSKDFQGCSVQVWYCASGRSKTFSCKGLKLFIYLFCITMIPLVCYPLDYQHIL